MSLQNRVDPFSRIHAVPARGNWMGNRGRLHSNDAPVLTKQTWSQKMWIICTMDFKGRAKEPMPQGRYTSLFFMDEATGLAAGHRPCFECRRPAAVDFAEAVQRGKGLSKRPTAPEIDLSITSEMKPHLRTRAPEPRQRVDIAALPDGAMFAIGEDAFLVWQGKAREWSWHGYGAPAPLPETALRLTPPTICAALSGGYTPQIRGLQEDT